MNYSVLDLGANHHDIPQTSPAWHEIRRGRFTASEIHRLICSRSRLKKGELLSKGAKNYVLETLWGQPKKIIETEAMITGQEREPEARFMFQCLYGVKVVETGFFTFSDWLGCSTDGIVLEPHLEPKLRRSVLEIKCPKGPTHLKYCLCRNWQDIKEANPLLYWQMNLALFVTGLHRCWFVSYHPTPPKKHLKLFSLCLERNETILTELADSLKRGWLYREELRKKLAL